MTRIWAVNPGYWVSVPGRRRNFPSLHGSSQIWGQEPEGCFTLLRSVVFFFFQSVLIKDGWYSGAFAHV